MAVVKFEADVFPYCKGDVVDLNADQQKHVDAVAKERGVKAYVAADKPAKTKNKTSDK